jgi:Cytosol aminopeptidase family, N-terminal domain
MHRTSFILRVITPTALLTLFSVLPMAGSQPESVNVADGPVPVQVLVESPAETAAELQVICLFRSSPENTLHGSLMELNQKLGGLLDRIRRPDFFRGELGETLLITPAGTIAAKRLLLIGLGDSRTFSPERMQFVGEILYGESERIGVSHPYFAPTILDGGVSKFTTGEVAQQVIMGFLRAAELQTVLHDSHASNAKGVKALTYLAGAKNLGSTRDGIYRAITTAKK